MLRRTSKGVKKQVDKMCLSAVLRFGRNSFHDVHSCPIHQKLQFVLRKLTTMTAWCRIRVIDLPIRNMTTLGTELVTVVLAKEQSGRSSFWRVGSVHSGVLSRRDSLRPNKHDRTEYRAACGSVEGPDEQRWSGLLKEQTSIADSMHRLRPFNVMCVLF